MEDYEFCKKLREYTGVSIRTSKRVCELYHATGLGMDEACRMVSAINGRVSNAFAPYGPDESFSADHIEDIWRWADLVCPGTPQIEYPVLPPHGATLYNPLLVAELVNVIRFRWLASMQQKQAQDLRKEAQAK